MSFTNTLKSNALFIIIFSILIYLIYKDISQTKQQIIEGFDIADAGMELSLDDVKFKKSAIFTDNVLVQKNFSISSSIPSFKIQATNGKANDNWWIGFTHGNNLADTNDRARIGVNILQGGAGRLCFSTGNANTLKEYMRIDELGRVGIRTNNPIAVLDIMETARTDTAPTTNPALYITNDSFTTDRAIPAKSIAEFRHSNQSQGIGITWDGIYATGSNANQNINITSRGNGSIRLNNLTHITNIAQGLLIARDDATWDHIHLWVNDDSSYFDIGGAEQGAVFRVGTGVIPYGKHQYQEVMRMFPDGTILLNNNKGGAVVNGFDPHHSIWFRKGLDNGHDVLDIREYGQIRFFTGGLIENQKQRMCIRENGNIGIGAIDPKFNLQIGSGAGKIATSTIRLQNGDPRYYNENLWGYEISGIDNGTTGHDLVFSGRARWDSPFVEHMRIKSAGLVGIGTPNPTNILQVGNGGRLRIANNDNDYTLLGTFNDDGDNNTRIVISGKNREVYGGGIEYVCVPGKSNFAHNFYINHTIPGMTILRNGLVGIGTPNPQALLHIFSPSQNHALIQSTTFATSLRAQNNAGGIDIGCAFNPRELSVSAVAGDGIIRVNPERKLHLQSGHNASAITIGTNNFVGIGTPNPKAPLDVNGFASLNPSSVGDKGHTFCIYSDAWPPNNFRVSGEWEFGNFSIIASHAIGALELRTNSDNRIKKNIEILDKDLAINKLRSIQPKEYNYIDYITNGSKKIYGFIAQEVKREIPEAVSYKKSYIPNIYKLCPFTKQTEKVINIELQSNELNINDKIKMIQDNNSEIYGIIINKNDSNIIVELDKELDPVDKQFENKIIVYGKEVDDFHVLNKDYLYAINFSATKELDKKVSILEEENKQLKQELSEVKSLLQQVLARLR